MTTILPTYCLSEYADTFRDILSRKQSAHKLCEFKIVLLLKVSLTLILLGCGFVAHLFFFLLIFNNYPAKSRGISSDT